MNNCNSTIYSSATIALIILDVLLLVISTVIHSPSIFNLISGLKTLICLLFIFIFIFSKLWHQDINAAKIDRTRFNTSLLLLLVHILSITISGVFSARFASYTLGLDPPLLLSSWFYLQRRQHITVQLPAVNPLQVQIEEALAPKKFNIQELIAITDNFDSLVATSSFATVFRGMLPNGTQVSVTRLNSPRDQSSNSAFVDDIRNATSCSHDNIMKYFGYCFTSDSIYSVLEFTKNHRVSDWIFSNDTGRRRTLSVARRYQVAVDVAKVFDYLSNHRKNFHFNVNSGCVLLDGNFRAKVLNSNLWRFLGEFKELINGDISLKYNFYSYGLLLLELITGQKHQQQHEIGETFDRLSFKLNEGKVLELVDQNLEIYEGDQQKLKQLLNVALLCVHQIFENRPSMVQVVAMLESCDHIPLSKEAPSKFMMPNFDVSSIVQYCSSFCDDDYVIWTWE